MFKFNHKNYEEFPVLEEGIYSFKIKKCEPQTSRKGDPMLKLELIVQGGGIVFDYILGTDTFLWKIKHLCDAIGHPELFEQDMVDPQFLVGKLGKCILKVEKQPGYPPANKVKDYVIPTSTQTGSKVDIPPLNSEADNFDDDDLPF